MKKNVMMRLASFLLVCVLVTTCGISGTFAKYVSKGEASDSARVAKWGVTITGKTGDLNDMFTTSHADTGDGYDGVSVQSDVAVVAPGTDGTFSAFTVEGTPEVAVRIRYEVEITFTGWELNGETYCPIIVTIGGTDYKIGDDETAAEFAERLEGLIAAYGDDYAVGETLQDEINLSWKWLFEGEDWTYQDDDKDTDLTELDPLPTISVNITCYAEQID